VWYRTAVYSTGLRSSSMELNNKSSKRG
jgi:hypothetical protein